MFKLGKKAPAWPSFSRDFISLPGYQSSYKEYVMDLTYSTQQAARLTDMS